MVIKDFRSPLPSEEGAPNFGQPQYALTIQAADIDGQPGQEVFARFPDGLHAYKYVPPAGGTSIDGGSWQEIGGAGGFGDAVGGADPGIYTTIQLGLPFDGPSWSVIGRRNPTQDDPASLAQDVLVNGAWLQGGFVGSFPPNGVETAWGEICEQPACYLDARAAPLATSVPDPSTEFQTSIPSAGQLVSRTRYGLSGWLQDGIGQWFQIGGTEPWDGPGSNNNPGPFADVPGPDCPFSSNGASGAGSGDCLGSSPAYYETFRTANVDGRPGDEVLARASDGLRVKRFNGHRL